VLSARDAFDAAFAERRAGRYDQAHRYFQSAGERVLRDPRALHEFAQTKLRLAGLTSLPMRRVDPHTRKRLLSEAVDFLHRVVQMDAPPARRARACYDLSRALRRLERPRADVLRALAQAVELAPGRVLFRRQLARATEEADAT
jgi:ATP-dependent DNA helicase RecG